VTISGMGKCRVKRSFFSRAGGFQLTHALVYCAVLLLLAGPGHVAAKALRVAVVSDLNGSYGSTRYDASVDAAVKRIVALRPDLVISTGDMVGGQRKPHLSQPEVEAMWRSFHAHVSDPIAAAGIPLAATPGNHDGSAYAGFETERRIYAEQWGARKPALRYVDDAHYPFYYAFAAGDGLFISLDATTVGHLPPEQMDWLRNLLTRHGSEYLQRILFSHVPLWPYTQGRETEYIGDPELERLLQQAKVGLYLSGHHHAFYPGHKDGVHYISQACLGAGPRKLIGSSKRSPPSFTLLELEGKNNHVAAFRSPDFTKPIDWHSLPEHVRSQAAELVRADLVDPELARFPIEKTTNKE